MWNATVFKDIMKTRRISAAQLAEKTGISNSSISLWTNGKQTPSGKAIAKLADALGVPVTDFSGDTITAPDDTARINVPVAECARLLGKSKGFVRVGLQCGTLPFGCAVNISGRRYTYYINPAKLNEYISNR